MTAIGNVLTIIGYISALLFWADLLFNGIVRKCYYKMRSRYYGWQVKRYYKRIFKNMPVHNRFLILPNGKLCYSDPKEGNIDAVGSGTDFTGWPTLYLQKEDFEETY